MSPIAPKQFGFQSSLITADVTTSIVALADTGLQLTLAANTNYALNLYYTHETAATTTGMRWAAQFTGALTQLSISGIICASSNTFTNPSNTTALNVLLGSATVGPGNATGDRYGNLQGLIRVGASGGTFKMQFASGVAASLCTLKSGAVLTAMPLL